MIDEGSFSYLPMRGAIVLEAMRGMASKAVKRDWQAYDIYRKDEEALFLEKVREMIWSLPPPYEEKQTGRPLYNPRSMAMIALLKMKFKKDYRSLESHLRARRHLLGIIGLNEAPSKSSIHLSLKRMPEPYLKKLNSILPQPFKGRA